MLKVHVLSTRTPNNYFYVCLPITCKLCTVQGNPNYSKNHVCIKAGSQYPLDLASHCDTKRHAVKRILWIICTAEIATQHTARRLNRTPFYSNILPWCSKRLATSCRRIATRCGVERILWTSLNTWYEADHCTASLWCPHATPCTPLL